MTLKVNQILHHEKSEYQDVLIFESSDHGTVLVLDNVIQCTERDEFSYVIRRRKVTNACSFTADYLFPEQLPRNDNPPRDELPPQPQKRARNRRRRRRRPP